MEGQSARITICLVRKEGLRCLPKRSLLTPSGSADQMGPQVMEPSKDVSSDSDTTAILSKNWKRSRDNGELEVGLKLKN